MVLKTGSVLVGKIGMSQRKIMKPVIALEENHAFHHESIAHRNQRMLCISWGYITLELVLKIIEFLFKHK